jgi:hypothetical protein
MNPKQLQHSSQNRYARKTLTKILKMTKSCGSEETVTGGDSPGWEDLDSSLSCQGLSGNEDTLTQLLAFVKFYFIPITSDKLELFCWHPRIELGHGPLILRVYQSTA